MGLKLGLSPLRKYRLKMYMKRMMTKSFGPNREEVTKGREKCIMGTFMISSPYYMILKW
jgi:hypothetical protein